MVQLQREEQRAGELHRGARHVQELVDVNVLRGFEKEYSDRLHHVADEITEELLAACMADLALAGEALFR